MPRGLRQIASHDQAQNQPKAATRSTARKDRQARFSQVIGASIV